MGAAVGLGVGEGVGVTKTVGVGWTAAAVAGFVRFPSHVPIPNPTIPATTSTAVTLGRVNAPLAALEFGDPLKISRLESERPGHSDGASSWMRRRYFFGWNRARKMMGPDVWLSRIRIV